MDGEGGLGFPCLKGGGFLGVDGDGDGDDGDGEWGWGYLAL